MDIDWSKAPEGATHYDAAENRINSFMKLENGRWCFWPPDSGSPAWTYWKPDNTDIKGMIPRPQAWNGEGPPPVGMACEFIKHNSPPAPKGQWETGKILYLSDCTIVIGVDGGERVHHPRNCSYRPIRTPEQIAAEERDAALNEMVRHVKDHPQNAHGVPHLTQLKIQEDTCIDLYDAGYRLVKP